jgi:hypothetical protein
VEEAAKDVEEAEGVPSGIGMGCSAALIAWMPVDGVMRYGVWIRAGKKYGE